MSEIQQSSGYKLIAIMIGALMIPLVLLIMLLPDDIEPEAAARVKDSHKLAVLPFSYEPHTEQVYLASYLAPALAENLGRRVPHDVRLVRQVSAKEAPSYDLVLNGMVQSSHETTLVTVQLMDRVRGNVIWNRVYRNTEEPFVGLPQMIARDIKFFFTEVREEPTPVNLSDPLFHAYLRGRYHLNSGQPHGLDKAAFYLSRVAQAAPDFAPVHGALARLYGLTDGPQDLPYYRQRRLARSHLERGLTLDDSMGELHLVRGTLLFEREWRILDAERSFSKCLRLYPNDSEVLQQFGLFMAANERHKEAVELLERALVLRPTNPTTRYNFGRVRLMGGDLAGARADFLETIRLDPSFSEAHVYAFLCRPEDEQETFKMALRDWVGSLPEMSRLQLDFAKLGSVSSISPQGRRVDLRRRRLPENQSPVFFAVFCVQARQKDLAFAWLEIARDKRDAHLPYLIKTPLFKSLSNQSRFKRLLGRLGLDANS
jgi:tetratricopeptide (TPR) repeat protein